MGRFINEDFQNRYLYALMMLVNLSKGLITVWALPHAQKYKLRLLSKRVHHQKLWGKLGYVLLYLILARDVSQVLIQKDQGETTEAFIAQTGLTNGRPAVKTGDHIAQNCRYRQITMIGIHEPYF